MRVLVTGAAGFMGSHLVDALVAAGHDVYGVDDMSGGFWRNVHPASHFTALDLRDQTLTAEYVRATAPAVIFHLAADATEGRSQFTPNSAVQRNLMAYLNTLTPAVGHGLQKVVLVSSMSVYGAQPPPFGEELERRPEDVYGVAKAAMERITEILADVHGFAYTIIRPHNVYGPRQNIADPYRNVVGIFINAMMNEQPFYIYGDGEQKRAFTYIDDFTPYLAKAGELDVVNGEIINIGPQEENTINTLAGIVLRAFHPRGAPSSLQPVHVADRPREVKEAFSTNAKAGRLLGYKTTVGLEDGVTRMVNWARNLGPQAPRFLPDGLEIVNDLVPVTWR
jgi:UDP-glucose 4-epimerase